MSEGGEAAPKWIRRLAIQSDEPCLLMLWMQSSLQSQPARRVNLVDYERYWQQHRALILDLIWSQHTEVLSDPDDSWAIMAFACTTPGKDIVHYACVKHIYTEWRDEMIKDLLGTQLVEPMFYTYVAPDIRPIPPQWVYDPYCLHGLLTKEAKL